MPERRLERGREHHLTETLQAPQEAPAGSFQALVIPDRALQALGRRVREAAYPVWAGVPGAFAACYLVFTLARMSNTAFPRVCGSLLVCMSD